MKYLLFRIAQCNRRCDCLFIFDDDNVLGPFVVPTSHNRLAVKYRWILFRLLHEIYPLQCFAAISNFHLINIILAFFAIVDPVR